MMNGWFTAVEAIPQTGVNIKSKSSLFHHQNENVHIKRWRHTYVVAFRHRDMVAYARERGFRHSYRWMSLKQRSCRSYNVTLITALQIYACNKLLNLKDIILQS